MEGDRSHEATSQRFEQLLVDFQARFAERSALIEKHLKEIHGVLLLALRGAEVRFQEPIAWRMKEEKSAIDSLRRRQEARLGREKDRKELISLGEKWDEYWKRNGREERIHDWGPFPDVESMFSGLHDIGGIRVLIYFPKDVEKIIKCLKYHKDIECVRTLQRGQDIAPDILMLKRYIAQLRKKKAPKRDSQADKMFPGYRATHIHVKPRRKHGEKEVDFVIEIQIATVVMNAWSQVEHDIIYKSENEPSAEKKSILDTFNGIVMVGENALRQLDEALTREREQRLKNSEEFATNIYDLGKWIADHCKENNKYPLEDGIQTWNYLDKLFEYLKTGKEHTSGKLGELIAEVLKEDTDDKMFNRDLPLFMLRQRCIDHKDKIPKRPDLDVIRPAEITKQLTRFTALRVVHCLNVAASLGVHDRFLEIMDKMLPPNDERPTLLDFLDILHPDKSRYDWSSLGNISEFCEQFLDMDKFRETIQKCAGFDDPSFVALMELPRRIVETRRIAYPIFAPLPDGSDPVGHSPDDGVIIPRTLCALLRDHNNTHWVPDIYRCAKDWKNVSDHSTLTTLEEYLHNRRVSEVHHADHLDVSEFWIERHGEVKTFRIPSTQGEKPHTRWIFNIKENNEYIIEFRADKDASRPRKHPGYFRSIPSSSPSSSSEVPKWSYWMDMPERWELRNLKNSTPNINRTITGFTRKSEFEDLANSMLPPGASITQTAVRECEVSYSVTLGETKFTLHSTKTEFILAKTVQSPSNRLQLTATPQSESSLSEQLHIPRDRRLQDELFQNGIYQDEGLQGQRPQTKKPHGNYQENSRTNQA